MPQHDAQQAEWNKLMAAIALLPDIDPEAEDRALLLNRVPAIRESIRSRIAQHEAESGALREAEGLIAMQDVYVSHLESENARLKALAERDSAEPELPAAAPLALGAEFELLVHHDRAGLMTSLSAPSIRARFDIKRDGANVIRKIKAVPMS